MHQHQSCQRAPGLPVTIRESPRGLSVRAKKLELYEAELDRPTAIRLERESGSGGAFVGRAKSFDNVVVVWIVDVVPVDIVSLNAMHAEFDGSVLDVLIVRKSLATAYSACGVSAIRLTTTSQRNLKWRLVSPPSLSTN